MDRIADGDVKRPVAMLDLGGAEAISGDLVLGNPFGPPIAPSSPTAPVPVDPGLAPSAPSAPSGPVAAPPAPYDRNTKRAPVAWAI